MPKISILDCVFLYRARPEEGASLLPGCPSAAAPAAQPHPLSLVGSNAAADWAWHHTGVRRDRLVASVPGFPPCDRPVQGRPVSTEQHCRCRREHINGVASCDNPGVRTSECLRRSWTFWAISNHLRIFVVKLRDISRHSAVISRHTRKSADICLYFWSTSKNDW